MTLIDEIKRAYPHPIRAKDATPDKQFSCYCVGGALCQFSKIGPGLYGFPAFWQIAETLCGLNRHLSQNVAESFAWEIIGANDEGDFDSAWKHAEEALAWRPTDEGGK